MRPIGWRWTALSAAETRVAELLLQGKGNKEIAAQLRLTRSRLHERMRAMRAKIGAGTTRAAISLLAECSLQLLIVRFLDDLPFAAVIVQDATIRYANPAYARMVGHPAADIVGMSIFEFAAGGHADIRRRHELRMRGGDARLYRVSAEVVCSNGTVLPVDAYTGLIELERRPASLAVILPTAPPQQRSAA